MIGLGFYFELRLDAFLPQVKIDANMIFPYTNICPLTKSGLGGLNWPIQLEGGGVPLTPPKISMIHQS